MSTGLSSPRPRPRAPRWPAGLSPWRKAVEAFLEKLSRLSGSQIEIEGAQSTSTGVDGTQRFKITPGGVEGGAWQPSVIDATHISLSGGTITDEVATFTPDLSSVVVHATNLNYVYLHVDMTPTFSAGWCTLIGITAADVVATTTPKTNTNSDWYLLLLEWQASALVQQHVYFSLQCEGGYGGADVASLKSWPIG